MTAGPRALVFAYACNPEKGSEPGAGAMLVTVVAGFSAQVTVITRREPGLDAGALALRLGENVRLIQTGSGSSAWPTYLRYLAWVLSAAAVARKLRTQLTFDVVHHATYASDWFVNPMVFMRKTLGERWVWGPAGGASYAPISVGRAVTQSPATSELLRKLVTAPMRTFVHTVMRNRVDVALALNGDSERRFRKSGMGEVSVQSNAVFDYAEFPARILPATPLVVYAGRGESWKGLPLVISAMRHLPPAWRLSIAGPGTDTVKFRRMAAPFGDRVDFLGALDRTTTLGLFARATAVALPSLHDSAPWAAGEAAGIGVPVVCLTLGGVAAMAGPLAIAVSPQPIRTLSERYGKALLGAAKVRLAPSRLHTEAALENAMKSAYGVEERL